MKLGPLNDAALAAAAVGAVKPERGAAPGATAPLDGGAAGVPVTVSAAARSLEAPALGSGIDEAKVAAVRAAIADGSFKVSSEAIADKLLANAQEVLSRVRS